jgi:hypothetical protein
MKNKIITIGLLLLTSSCSTRRYARVDPYFDDRHVLIWGRVIPVVDGKENYRNCSVYFEGGRVPIDRNGVFVSKILEEKATANAVRCGNRVVELPANYATFRKNAGPRSIYLGSLMVKFGSSNSAWTRRFNTAWVGQREQERDRFYNYTPTSLDYFAVQDHFYKDKLLLGSNWNIPLLLQTSKAILQTPGVKNTDVMQTANNDSSKAPADSLTRQPASTGETKRSDTYNPRYYDYFNGYSYDRGNVYTYDRGLRSYYDNGYDFRTVDY